VRHARPGARTAPRRTAAPAQARQRGPGGAERAARVTDIAPNQVCLAWLATRRLPLITEYADLAAR
jgi:hypothetical protein